MQRLGWALAALVFVLDQISKPIILDLFEQRDHWIEVTPFFNIVLAFNKGVSFSMMWTEGAHGPYLLAGLSLLIAAAIWWFLLRRAQDRWMAVSCGLIIGGALGNALDRLLYGAVVDFLDFHAMGYHWPAFNVADCGIVVGACLMAIDGLFGGKKLPK